MNKFIKEQLDNLESVDVQQVSELEYIIKRKASSDSISLNHYYLIELADYIIHPSDNFTLAANWNSGLVPTSKQIKAMVTQILGKMLKIDGIGDDNKTYMGLWLPMGGIKVVKEL